MSSSARATPPCAVPDRHRRAQRHRRPLRHPRRLARLRRRARAGRDREACRQAGGVSRARGGARLRRFRGESRVAHALSRPRLGSRQGARHALQHGRRPAHGARHRRLPVRQLVRASRGVVGALRARVRRARHAAQLVPPQLSAVDHDQRRRPALRRRRHGVLQLHVREIRRRGAEAAGPFRVAGVRRESARPAAPRVPQQGSHTRHGGHARRARGQAKAWTPKAS